MERVKFWLPELELPTGFLVESHSANHLGQFPVLLSLERIRLFLMQDTSCLVAESVVPRMPYVKTVILVLGNDDSWDDLRPAAALFKAMAKHWKRVEKVALVGEFSGYSLPLEPIEPGAS